MRGAKYWNEEVGWCMLLRPMDELGKWYLAWQFKTNDCVYVDLADPKSLTLCCGVRRMGKELVKK